MTTTKPKTNTTENILDEVGLERLSQNEQWGQQEHDSAHGASEQRTFASMAENWKQINSARVEEGSLTWDGILLEEVYEAVSEPDLLLRRAELLQVAAVAVAEVESIDRLILSDQSPYAQTKELVVVGSTADVTPIEATK